MSKILKQVLTRISLAAVVILTWRELHLIRLALESPNPEKPAVHDVVTPEPAVDSVKVQREALRRIYSKIRMYRSGLSDGLVYRIANAVHESSVAYGIDEDMILAVMRVESWFDPNAVSNMGAVGLMQVMPFWAKVLPDCKNLYEVRTNVRCGTQIYLIYLEQFGDPDVALAAYNRGPRSVNAALRKGQDPVKKYSKDVAMYLDELKNWRDPSEEQVRAASL